MINAKQIRSLLNSQPSAPCDKFACPSRSECSVSRLACSAFRIYAETGQALSPLYEYKERQKDGVEAKHVGRPTPSREIYIALQQDRPASEEAREATVKATLESGVSSLPELHRIWS